MRKIFLAPQNSKPAVTRPISPLYYTILHRQNKMYILQTNTSTIFFKMETIDKHTQKN